LSFSIGLCILQFILGDFSKGLNVTNIPFFRFTGLERNVISITNSVLDVNARQKGSKFQNLHSGGAYVDFGYGRVWTDRVTVDPLVGGKGGEGLDL
jgi:hypothetical protein